MAHDSKLTEEDFDFLIEITQNGNPDNYKSQIEKRLGIKRELPKDKEMNELLGRMQDDRNKFFKGFK